MSYDPIEETDEPRCTHCRHIRSKHEYIGQPGYRLGDKETPRFGRCRAKKCLCWKYIGKDAPNA